MHRPVVGEKWRANSFENFLVTDVKVVNGSCWVYYKKISNNQEYHCLEESFTFRFQKVVNEGN